LRQLSSLKVIDEIRKDLKEKLNEFGGEKCLE
jgi:hypothetical protein